MPIDAELMRARLATAVGESLVLGELLGTGAFAAVFRAHDPFLERDVAIKVLDPALGVAGELQEQFLHEARTVAGVEHPHIVPLYTAESREGLVYLVMRLLPGQSLATRLKTSGPMEFVEAARLAHEVAMALATAHDRGVVHRDIKPENILLDGAGHATVTDFGIARVTARQRGEAAGFSSGTPHYMSPEQALGEDVDGRADVYSLGVVLYRMLCGTLPFEAANLTELIGRQLNESAPSVSSIRHDTPAALSALVDRMLMRDRTARPTAAEAVTLLAAARTPDALLTPPQVKAKRWRKRASIIGVVAVTGTVVLVGVGYVAISLLRVFLFGDQGGPPRLSIAAPDIPDSVLAAVRSDGLLQPDEKLVYAFIPSNGDLASALGLTESAILVRSVDGARRILLADGVLNVNRRARGGVIRGSVVMRLQDQPPDTIYSDLSGLDATALLSAVKRFTSDTANARTP
jgi:serine/threonine-protein kinase